MSLTIRSFVRSLLNLLYTEKLKMLTTFKNGFFRETEREKNEKNYILRDTFAQTNKGY